MKRKEYLQRRDITGRYWELAHININVAVTGFNKPVRRFMGWQKRLYAPAQYVVIEGKETMMPGEVGLRPETYLTHEDLKQRYVSNSWI